VELHKPDWIYHLENIRRRQVHYIDLWYNSKLTFERLIYSNPYRIVYWIEYFVELKSFKVTQKTLIGCYDYKSYFENIQRHCKTHLKFETELRKCVLKTTERLPLLASVMPFDINSNDRRGLQSCSNQAIGYSGKNFDNYPSNFYFRQYKPSETDLDPILISVLFSNVSIVNKNWHLELENMEYPISRTLDLIGPSSVFVVASRFDAVQFITCAPMEQPSYLSLLGYISAFDATTWLLILFTFILSVLVWNRIFV